VEQLEERTVLSFAAPAVFDLGAATAAVAVGHFEGAGAPPDVVAANANGTLRVLLGNGDGSFQNPITITLSTTPKGLAVGDLLGNGRDDIVAANANGTVTVLLSNGNGTFQAPETLAVGGFINAVAVGDFLGNGLMDIVTTNTNHTVSALLSNGDGTFQAPVITPVNTFVKGVATGDFNGDGKADLALASGAGVTVLQSNGDGSFSPLTTISLGFDQYTGEPIAADTVAVADLRGAGKLDLVAQAEDQLRVVLGNGDGTFGTPSAPFDTLRSFVVADFTGDGKPDIVSLDFVGQQFTAPTLRVLVGNGDGTFHFGSMVNTGVIDSTLAAGDFAGTGHADLVLANSFNHFLTILPGNGDGTLATAPNFFPGDFLAPAATGVFTAGGRQDLVLMGQAGGSGTGIVRVMFGNGDGTFTKGPTLSFGIHRPDAVVVADFNGDGSQDIAVDTGSGTLTVFLGNGDGTFQPGQTLTLGNGADVLGPMVVGDFNGDGTLDLAVGSEQIPSKQTDPEITSVTILTGNGDGTFTKTAVYNVGQGIVGALAAADLRGSGTPDLIFTTGDPATDLPVAKVMFGSGDGTFQAPFTVFTGDRSLGLAVGDFLGHGRTDILATKFDGTASVLANNGDGTFASPIVSQIGFFPGSPVVGDFFHDGHLSLAGINNGVVSALRGNGDGTFQAPVGYLVGAGFHSLVVGDFNGDGKPDLAVGNTFPAGNGPAYTTSVLLNTSPPPSNADPVATATTLAVNVSSAVFGQPVALTATVTAANGVPTGTVTFLDGDTPLGEVALDPNGQATLILPLGVGVHSLRASFAGIAPFTGSTSDALSLTISKAATTTGLSVDLSLLSCGIVYLTATIAPVAPGAGVPTGIVTFFDGTKVVGTAVVDKNGQATLVLDSLAKGTHTLTAAYGGDGNFLDSVSDPLTITI
jgi:hypothetical protein